MHRVLVFVLQHTTEILSEHDQNCDSGSAVPIPRPNNQSPADRSADHNSLSSTVLFDVG